MLRDAPVATLLQDAPLPVRLAVPAATTVAAPAPTQAPAQRAAPVAARSLMPLHPRQLTNGGCCAGAWWEEDSSGLRFVDRPEGSPSTVILSVEVWPPGSAPRPVGPGDTVYGPGNRLVVQPADTFSWVTDQLTGDRWQLPTGGHPVRVSPDGKRVVWWEYSGGWEQHGRLVSAQSSDVFGGDLRDLGGLWGMDVLSFLPDSRRVLVTGRPARNRPLYVVATIDVLDGRLQQLAKGFWISDASASPDGEYVAFLSSLDRGTPENNGIWVVSTAGGQAPRKLDFVGAYHWRDGHRLAYVPMLPGSGPHAVWQVDAAGGPPEQLFDPAVVPIRIANNDWSISPDGYSLAYRSEIDGNIWVVDLP